MGTRFGTELPGPQPPQEYVDDLRGRFSLQGIWVDASANPLAGSRADGEGLRADAAAK
jgi:hypothetical protein